MGRANNRCLNHLSHSAYIPSTPILLQMEWKKYTCIYLIYQTNIVHGDIMPGNKNTYLELEKGLCFLLYYLAYIEKCAA